MGKRPPASPAECSAAQTGGQSRESARLAQAVRALGGTQGGMTGGGRHWGRWDQRRLLAVAAEEFYSMGL